MNLFMNPIICTQKGENISYKHKYLNPKCVYVFGLARLMDSYTMYSIPMPLFDITTYLHFITFLGGNISSHV